MRAWPRLKATILYLCRMTTSSSRGSWTVVSMSCGASPRVPIVIALSDVSYSSGYTLKGGINRRLGTGISGWNRDL